MMSERILFDATQTAELVDRVATQIIDAMPEDELRNGGIIGIHRHGVPVARMLAAKIKERTGIDVAVGTLDINMYRDDIGRRKTLPAIHETSFPFDLEDHTLILADDVLHTGRSIRAALDAVTDFGRPRVIRLAVLLDRGARELPIQPDFTGETHAARDDEWVQLFEQPEGGAVIRIRQRKSFA